MALPWAMMLLVMASALSAVLLERGRGLAGATRHDGDSLRALYAAEGGLALARHTLAVSPDYEGGRVRVGACEVRIRVTRQDDGWTVTTLARPGGVRLDAVLRLDALPRVTSWRER
jgi:hypothetical protein